MSRRRWLWAGLAAGITVNSLRLRSLVEAIPVLAEPGADAGDADGYALVTAEGVDVDAATFAAAVSHARSEGLQVLDLVPGDLGAEQVLELVRQVDPAAYRTQPLLPGRGAYHALVVADDVLARADLPATSGLDRVEMVLATMALRQFAPRATHLAVAPRLRAVPDPVDRRLALVRAVAGATGPALLALPPAEVALLLAGLGVAPGWALAALAAYGLQPLAATAGTALHPVDATPASALTRWWREPKRALDTMRGRWQPEVVTNGDPRAVEQRRPEYDELLAGGVARFLEPRRTTCPLCASPALRRLLRSRELMQHKPGVFELDECLSCGHVFQNPRLTVEGLDFYYRDFYDGLNQEQADQIFNATEPSYRGRAEFVARRLSPRRWLDVGGGHGHFCLIAAEALPDTTFDGLDVSESIDEAARRGWIDHRYRGLFPDLATELAGTYDVVSLNHELEHTRDPGAELDAARVALAPGGHLLVEVPDPDCRLSRLLGRWWLPWFQPQHQHFVSRPNLHRLLGERGFTVVAEETGPPHQPVDFVLAAYLLAQAALPPPERPWLPRPTLRQRVLRILGLALFAPLLALGAVLDAVLAPLLRRVPGGSNTYRLLARKDEIVAQSE